MPSSRAVLTGAVAAQAAVSLVGFGLPSIGPEIQTEYDLSLAALGAALTANLLGSGVFLIPAGIVVDRYGSRTPLVSRTKVSHRSISFSLRMSIA